MRIAILGAGRMGSWLARALSAEHEIAVFDSDSARMESGGSAPGIKRLGRLEELGGFAPKMLINAVSLQNTIEAFRSAVPFLPEDCIICDVASVKGDIPAYYKGCGFRFASVHPMFGPTFADMAALKDENAVIIRESDPEGAAFFRELFGKLGLRIFDYTFAEHDRMMAYSLTTPFTASLVFAACMESAAVPGTTFAKHRALARGLLSEDDHLLAEILFNGYSLPQLEKITARLEFLKHIIKARDFEEAQKFFGKLRENVG
jgi:prephenate dehydrogenase